MRPALIASRSATSPSIPECPALRTVVKPMMSLTLRRIQKMRIFNHLTRKRNHFLINGLH
jgi:hypothetical protein